MSTLKKSGYFLLIPILQIFICYIVQLITMQLKVFSIETVALITILTIFVLFFILGFLLARFKSFLPNGFYARYSPFFIIPLYIMTAGIVLFIYDIANSSVNIDIFNVLFMPVNSYIIPFLYAFNGNITYLIGILSALLSLIMLLGFKISERKMGMSIKINNYLVPIVLFICFVLAISSTFIYKYDSTPVLQLENELGSNELTPFQPFMEGNKLAKVYKTPSYTVNNISDFPAMDGATAFYPIYAAAAQAVYNGSKLNLTAKDFEGNHNIDKLPYYVQCNKTSEAYNRIISGSADIIFVLEPSEQQKQQSANLNLVYTPIAKEAFVFFVAKNNPVNNLTVQQIQGIYTGDIYNWNKVGGFNSNIKAFQRPENSGSQTIMLSAVMKGRTMKAPVMDEVVSSMMGIIKEVSDYKNSPGSIGYSFLYYSSSMAYSNSIKLLSINGVKPNTASIKNGSYPLIQNVYAVTNGNNQEKVKPLLDWILSDEGQELVGRTGYVSIK